MTKRRIAYGLLLGLAVLVPLVTVAVADMPTSGDKDDSHGRLFLVLRMADELDLSDEKALAVSAALKQAEERRDELRNERSEIARQIRAALDAKKPDEAALTKLVDQSIDLDRRRAKAMEDSFTSLKKILTVQEQAKLVLLRTRMRHESGPGGGHGRFWQRRGRPDGERGPGGPPPGGDHDATLDD